MSINRLRCTMSLGIRTQLTLWYTAVFATLILLFSLILYTTFQTSLAAGVDSALQLRTQQIAAGISNDSGKITIRDVTGELPGLEDDPREKIPTRMLWDDYSGVLVHILDAKGKTIYISPAFRTLVVPSASVTQPLTGASWQGTVMAHDGRTVRLYSAALTDNGTAFGVIQVGESLAQLAATLQGMTVTLLVLAPFVLLLSALGSYWLAKRALTPIHYLTYTARSIKAGDLKQRVPVPRARDEVQDLALTLNEMIERLDQAFTQQRRFVADASHELRTPVTVLRNLVEVALAAPLDAKEYIAVLHNVCEEAERLGQLINGLLVLTRADEGQTQFDSEPVRLDLLTLDVVATLEPLAMRRGIILHTEKLEPITVLGDTARLIVAMMGLVDNAITYTNAGGTVTLTTEASGATASFSVRDTGIGIAPMDLAHIFERFYRADPARSRAVGGSGLGLAIVDWVIRAHGGSITVESQVGEGSTFTVTLPLATSEQSSDK